jgi:acetyl-CoA synthetase
MYGTTEIGVILVSYPGAADFIVKRGSLGKPIPGGRLGCRAPEAPAYHARDHAPTLATTGK